MFYAQDLNEHVTQLDIYNKTPAVIYSVLVAHIDKNDVMGDIFEHIRILQWA